MAAAREKKGNKHTQHITLKVIRSHIKIQKSVLFSINHDLVSRESEAKRSTQKKSKSEI
jgi:hypothetical protein